MLNATKKAQKQLKKQFNKVRGGGGACEEDDEDESDDSREGAEGKF